MRYGSVCSGIEAATAAWHHLGWKPSFFSEIEAFPRAVLQHHYPNVPLHGDFTTIQGNEYDPIDLLVGGTPCQSFSIAGLRGGLDDDRGNLALQFLRLADRTRPRWLVWENVPGVLSSNKGGDFASIIGGMVELGYGIAYRILDAQYFGVAQRRRRVFVIGYLGDWRRAAAVLFERQSLQRHPAPRRKKGKKPAGNLTSSPSTGRSPNEDATLNAGSMGRQDYESETFVTMNAVAGPLDSHYGKGPGSRAGGEREFVAQITGTLNANGKAAGSATQQDAETGMLIAFHAEAQADQLPTAGRDTSISDSLTTSQHAAVAFEGDVARTLSARHDGSPCADRGPNVVAVTVGALACNTGPNGNDAGNFACNQAVDAGYVVPVAYSIMPMNSGKDYKARETDIAEPIMAGGPVGGNQGGDFIAQPCVTSMQVRRLTPRECERLQGFPDDYTLIPYRSKPAADGPRYKALGNSMAVPVMRWIGERIQMVENLTNKR